MAGRRKSNLKTDSEFTCCVICVSNASSEDAKDSAYWWNALHELGSKLIDMGYGQFIMSASPSDKRGSIMVSYDKWPVECKEPFSEKTITKLAWDLQKEFDYLVSCKVDGL